MPENTDPQVVLFANGEVRPGSNRAVQLYETLKDMIQEYNSQNIGGQIDAAGAGELIADGSAQDGRPQITGGDIYNFVTFASDFVSFIEDTPGRLDVIYKAHTD